MDAGTNVEALLEHSDWVRALARTLVADSAQAEDVAQEAWLAALRHPPRDASNPRGWLATVVRNAARKLARERVRRAAREADVARDDALPSAAELVEQTNLQRELAGLVVELDEPYRSTLLLRFFQGLEAAEIAARSGVPVATVRTRVQRGLASLREKLDRRHGDRATWLAAFVPFAARDRIPPTWRATESGLRTPHAAWVAGLVAIALLAVWSWRAGGTNEPDGSVAVAPPTSVEPLVSVDASSLGREPVVPDSPRSGAIAVPGVGASATYVARCVDLEGRPLAGIEFEFVDEREVRVDEAGTVWTGNQGFGVTDRDRERYRNIPQLVDQVVAEHPGYLGMREALLGLPFGRPCAKSGPDGELELVHDDAARGSVRAAGSRWILVASADDEDDPRPLLVVAPRVELAGVVVDADGLPLANARVDLSAGWHDPALPDRRVRRIELIGSWSTECDGVGRFRFPSAPGVAGEWINAQRSNPDGSLWHGHAVLDGSSELELRITTELQAAPKVNWVRGRVVDETGSPVEGATVALGQDTASTDESGAYSLRVRYWPDERTLLTASKVGLRPTLIEAFAEQRPTGEDVTAPNLVLGPTLPPIRGRVLDVDGAPAKGWRVALLDGTRFASTSLTVEEWSASTRQQDGHELDSEGRFELGGLLDRPYRVHAWHPGTLAELRSEPVRAGQELDLRVPTDAVRPRLAGRVDATDGTPLDGVVVQAGVVVFDFGGWRRSAVRSTVTDRSGRFEFRDIGRSAYLSVGSEGVEDASFPAPTDADCERSVLVAKREFSLRLEGAPERCDRFSVFDSEGQRLLVRFETPSLSSDGHEVERIDGEFPLTIVPEEAATLVLLHGETVLRKVPLQLRWRELTVVTP
ncbi:MAG: sigma-70 family RNA polymerase sigma factor [Planctomycetes bacterium]|nr:sigma-70 family RNA polymerase sigma factor [Planctomycetota bacterium]